MATFCFEGEPLKSKKSLSKVTTAEKSLKLRSFKQKSEKTEFEINPESTFELNKIQKQLCQLKRQNRNIGTSQTHLNISKTEMESFFWQIVN